jgi:hypothetical protein
VKCYYDERDAVGVCKYCGRGVCHESGVTVAKGLACKGRCEAEVETLMGIIAKNRTIYQRTAAVYGRYALSTALFGLLFIAFGIFQQQYLDRMAIFFDAAGLVILLTAGFAYYNRRKIKKA